MSFLIVTIGFTLAISSKWAYSYFGLSSFEQIVYHIKVPLEGTNTQFIFGWMKKCLLPGVIFGLIFMWVPKTLAWILFGLCCVYGLCQIHIFSYIFDQFKTTDFYDRYYQDNTVISPEKKMNFIHIYLESMETTYAKKEDGGDSQEDLLPFLTQLTKDHISFSQNKKIGGARVLTGTGWTTGGIVASTSGLPLIFSLKHKFCKENVPFMPKVKTLGDILEKDGYNRVFMIGSDATFGGRRSYFEQHGHYNIQDTVSLKEEGLLDKDYHEFWGFEDDKLFDFAKDKLTKLAKEDKPFDFEMLTVDTHHPYGYQSKNCKNIFKESLSNSIYHTDENLKDFFSWLKKQDFYENTVIVVQGDHTSMAAEYIHDTYDAKFDRRVWNTFIHSRVKSNHTTDRDFTTMDLYPTILAALGYQIQGNKLGLGTNLFSEEKTLTEQIDAKNVDTQIKRKSKFYRGIM